MKKNTMKAAALAAAAGCLLQFGCLNLGGLFNPQRLLQGAAMYALQEYVLDNDAVYDLFEDGGVVAAE